MSQSSQVSVPLLGRILIRGVLEVKTGLFIGGTNLGVSIGGVDHTVVRNTLNNEPYIPGSSLKGKMRSLLEKARGDRLDRFMKGNEQSKRIEQIKIHVCKSPEKYAECPVCNLFGVTPEDGKEWKDPNAAPFPTRLIVRDAPLTRHSYAELQANTNLDMPLTEIKTEVAIDRLTSAANPRQRERVPAGAKFRYEIVFNLYKTTDLAFLVPLMEAMSLVEGDYLGGQGSRGYGHVSFGRPLITSQVFNGQGLTFPGFIQPEDPSKQIDDKEEQPLEESLKGDKKVMELVEAARKALPSSTGS